MMMCVRQDALEQRFMSTLIEDRNPTAVSYVDFLCHIHTQIQNKFN